MTRQEVTGNYIINMERERVRRGYTQPQMAKHMGISTSGYKKIVAGETSKIDLYAAYQLYKFTGKFIFELCGEESADLELFQSLRSLSPSQKAFVSDIIRFEQNFQEKEMDSGEYISVLVPSGSLEDGMIWDSANVIKVRASSTCRSSTGSALRRADHLPQSAACVPGGRHPAVEQTSAQGRRYRYSGQPGGWPRLSAQVPKRQPGPPGSCQRIRYDF